MGNMKIRTKREAQHFFSWLLYVVGIVGGLYVGCWSMFIKPIIVACQHFDAGTLTGMIVGITVLKCVCASTVGLTIAYMGAALCNIVDGTY